MPALREVSVAEAPRCSDDSATANDVCCSHLSATEVARSSVAVAVTEVPGSSPVN